MTISDCSRALIGKRSYFSFELHAKSPCQQALHRCIGVVVLPIAFILWIFPFRLACVNIKAFGHLCLEPYLAKIEYKGRFVLLILGTREKAANKAMFDFLETQYFVVTNPMVSNLLSYIYSWRFLQVDIGKYCYMVGVNAPCYSEVIRKYGHTKASRVYQADLIKWIGSLVISKEFQAFLEQCRGKYVCIHWRADFSNRLHNIRSSTSEALSTTIPFLQSRGYGICVVGDGYSHDDPLLLEMKTSSNPSYIVCSNMAYYGIDDIYALAHCRVAILGDSGVNALPGVLDIPVVVHNVFSIGLPKLRTSWQICYKSLKYSDYKSMSKKGISQEEINNITYRLRFVADGLAAKSINLEVYETISNDVLSATKSLIGSL